MAHTFRYKLDTVVRRKWKFKTIPSVKILSANPNVSRLKSVLLEGTWNMYWCYQDDLVTRGSEMIAILVLRISTMFGRFR